MSKRIEPEIREDLTSKLKGLEALHGTLAHKLRAQPKPPPKTLVEALELASASVRDCAVYQENHFGGLISLAPETLGDSILVLRAAETVIKDVISALLPEVPEATAPRG